MVVVVGTVVVVVVGLGHWPSSCWRKVHFVAGAAAAAAGEAALRSGNAAATTASAMTTRTDRRLGRSWVMAALSFKLAQSPERPAHPA